MRVHKLLSLILVLALSLGLSPAALASGEPDSQADVSAAEAVFSEETADGAAEAPDESAPAEPEIPEPADEPAAEETDEPDAEETEKIEEPEPAYEPVIPAYEPAEAPAFDGLSNEETCYRFLTGVMGFNAAAACGIMANIYCESRFDPNVTGDHSTSYGICQWHDWGTNEGRYTNLKNFCAQNGYDYHTLEGQLYFLKYELETSWYGLAYVRKQMYTFPDTPQGAYDAGCYWCKEFGRPADSNENPRRGVLSRDTFYPKYGSYVAVDYTVRFDADGGIAVASVTVTEGSRIGTLPTTTRPGYTFGGWYSGKNGQGTRLTADTVINGDQTWYARWDADRYTVAFDTQTNVTGMNTKTVEYGAAYGTLPMPGRSGYRFDGWFTEPEGGRQVTAETVVTETRNHTLYAHWTPFTMTYSVSYNANGGSGAPMPQNKQAGTGLTLTATQPRRAGFVFLGWAVNAQARRPDYAPGDVYGIDAAVVLYAVWRSEIPGDADGDGDVDPADAALVLEDPGAPGGDMTGDGKAVAYDAALILRAIVGL